MKIDESLQHRLTALAAEEGLELVATELVGSGPKTILRLVVDGPEGVTLSQCADISRQASALLDVEDPFQHHYTLEVSSPGLDRKLYGRSDFERFAGHQLRVRMQPSHREHRTVIGTLLALDGNELRIAVDNDEVVGLPFDQVFEARLEVDWKSMLKKKKRKNRP